MTVIERVVVREIRRLLTDAAGIMSCVVQLHEKQPIPESYIRQLDEKTKDVVKARDWIVSLDENEEDK